MQSERLITLDIIMTQLRAPLNPSIPHCCDARVVFNWASTTAKGAGPSEGYTPNGCRIPQQNGCRIPKQGVYSANRVKHIISAPDSNLSLYTQEKYIYTILIRGVARISSSGGGDESVKIIIRRKIHNLGKKRSLNL